MEITTDFSCRHARVAWGISLRQNAWLSLCKLSTGKSNSRGFGDRCTQKAKLSIRSFKTFNPKLILNRNQFYLQLCKNANQRTTSYGQIIRRINLERHERYGTHSTAHLHMKEETCTSFVISVSNLRFLLFLRVVHSRDYSNCSLLDLQRRRLSQCCEPQSLLQTATSSLLHRSPFYWLVS